MPITKIQLRGISRVPSDRLVKDGDCAESLNVMMRESETVPMVAPEDITADGKYLSGLSSAGIDVLYIHKTNEYAHYIGLKTYEENGVDVLYLVAYCPGIDNPTIVQIRSVSGTYDIESITSVGNMLLYSLYSGETYYALYKYDNNTDVYVDLGDSIPKPSVIFYDAQQATPATEQKEYDIVSLLTHYAAEKGITDPDDIEPLDFWDYVRATRTSSDEYGQAAETLYQSIHDDVWEYVNNQRYSNRESNYFTAPVLARYAVRLYDGSYVHISEPIMLSGVNHAHVRNIKANLGDDGNGHWKLFAIYGLATAFSVNLTITLANATDWGDIIDSVDVFLSTDILLPKMKAELAAAAQAQTQMSVTNYTIRKNDISIKFVGNEEDTVSSFEATMLDQVNFYKVASYRTDELPPSDTLKPWGQDDLVVLQRLEEGDSSTILPSGHLGSFNNRIVSGTQVVTLSPGHNQPQSISRYTTGSSLLYSVLYYIRNESGEINQVRGYNGVSLIDGTVRGYISYPDPRCYRADLYVCDDNDSENIVTTFYSIPMKEHPGLNCSYGFWGLNTRLDEAGGGRAIVTTFQHDERPGAGNPTYTIDNRLALSEVDNPLVFPVEQRMRFSARIIAALPATVALSTNQSGPLPIYVFTEDGIWAVSITAEGGLARSFVVSRDVAVGDIKQLDGAILFVTERGVMLLSGQKVKNLSLEMNGKTFVPTNDLVGLVQTYSPTLNFSSADATPFRDFVLSSEMAYDYTNNRVIFFSSVYRTTQYVLELGNQSWHRMKLGGNAPRMFKILNSYPYCYVFFGDADETHGGSIMNFSTILYPDSSADALPGLIVTRDLNLGGNDIYKTIKRLYIRGDRYPDAENDAPWKYVLLGSNDRKNYHVLHSLRGPSWKFYRVAIATTMQEGGRISYIEIDWDPRYTDRIR